MPIPYKLLKWLHKNNFEDKVCIQLHSWKKTSSNIKHNIFIKLYVHGHVNSAIKQVRKYVQSSTKTGFQFDTALFPEQASTHVQNNKKVLSKLVHPFFLEKRTKTRLQAISTGTHTHRQTKKQKFIQGLFRLLRRMKRRYAKIILT